MKKDMENSNNYSLIHQQSEIIAKIENLGGNFYPNSALSIEDQLFICESLAKTVEQENFTSTYQDKNTSNKNRNVHVNGMVNDTYKRRVNFELTESKLRVITKLQKCSYRTSPTEISVLLEEFFANLNTKPNHWLYIAQQYSPRPINRVINKLIKIQTSGRLTIQNPAAYFTHLIKYRKKRKLTAINGIRLQQL